MSSSPPQQKGVLKKAIAKRKKFDLKNEEEPRMTRFKTKAKICTICYTSIESQGVIDSCNHEFCFTCIQKWSQTENTCPLCKKRFSSLKKTWNRHFYGKKAALATRKKIAESGKPSEIEEEIAVPTRNQGQTNRLTNGTRLGGALTEQLLNLMISLFPPLPNSGDNEDDLAFEILYSDPSFEIITRLSPMRFSNFSNSE